MVTSESCRDNPISSPEARTEKGSWTKYTPYDWEHDGEPYKSAYCTIYSDAASNKMKQRLGEIADRQFVKILRFFDFQNTSDFVYPPGYSEIEIYLNIVHEENIAWAYWGGFIITIRSNDITGDWYDYAEYTTTHELTHVFEFLIEGREVPGTEVWFKEGLAVHIGCLENSVFKTIKSPDELESWISENKDSPGKGNPVSIHRIDDFPANADWTRYYQFFELAIRYLLDQNGLGKAHQDVLNLFYDLRDEKSFQVSFENHFGISVRDYESEFFSRMRIFLNEESIN